MHINAGGKESSRSIHFLIVCPELLIAFFPERYSWRLNRRLPRLAALRHISGSKQGAGQQQIVSPTLARWRLAHSSNAFRKLAKSLIGG